MENKTIAQLSQLNIDFYSKVAVDFDDSRHYFWQGWEKIPPLLDTFSDIRVADIGCGNGRFGQFLFESCPQMKLSYTGIDSNVTLLTFAKNNLKGKIPALHLQQVDVISALQNDTDFLGDKQFQLITSFGVFHHIPSFELRLKLLQYLLSKLTKDGYLVISFWQFMNFERFRKKIITDQKLLEMHNIQLMKLEEGDYILDWNRGEKALRYCHFTNEVEQLNLINQAHAKLIKTYVADGKENAVNQYVILTHNT